jgi:hypothetical protein
MYIQDSDMNNANLMIVTCLVGEKALMQNRVRFSVDVNLISQETQSCEKLNLAAETTWGG